MKSPRSFGVSWAMGAMLMALAIMVLWFQPTASSMTALSGDCAVSPEAQQQGWCCLCLEYPDFYCEKSQVTGAHDRCDSMMDWCGGECHPW